MNELAAMLAAIRANPNEDATRLVTADLLTELGFEGWAELIRCQINLGLLRTLNERNEQEDDEIERLANLERRSLCPFLQNLMMIGIPSSNWVFSNVLPFVQSLKDALALDDQGNLYGIVVRGFVDEIDCSYPRRVQHGDELLNWLPIQIVYLWCAPELVNIGNDRAIVGDPRNSQIMLELIQAAQFPGEQIEMAACRVRWPGIRFGLQGGNVMPEITAHEVELLTEEFQHQRQFSVRGPIVGTPMRPQP